MKPEPAIGECCFCPGRYMGWQSGVNARGQPVFMCEECRLKNSAAVVEIPVERKPARAAAPTAAGKDKSFLRAWKGGHR